MSQKIRVGIDIRDLRIAKTGARTYLTEIVRVFQKEHVGFEFHFLDTFIPVYTGKNKFFKLIEHFRYTFYKQVYLPICAWIKGCDIVFATDYFVPLWQPGFKTIPVFHDAFFWQYPEHYNQYWLLAFKKLCLPAAKKSPYIVTPTNFATAQIRRFFDYPEHKFIAVPEAPKTLEVDLTGQMPEILKDKKYLLHIGVFEKRKNLEVLVQAFQMLRASGHNLYLVLVGQFSPKEDLDDSSKVLSLIEQYQLSDYVILPGYVPDASLIHYYKNAFAYVFPSYNEGFGLPVLEAFQHEIPVLISNNSSLPEVGGEAALQFDPAKPEEIHFLIQKLTDDENLRLNLIKEGTTRLNKYTWENTALKLKEIFRKAVN